MGELGEPTVTNNQERFRALMKEQSDLTPIVEAYKEYKKSRQDIEDSLVMLSANRGRPLILCANKGAAIGYRNIAFRLEGRKVPIMGAK